MAEQDKLSAAAVRAALRKPGRHRDGYGLVLDVEADACGKICRARWILIYTFRGRRREMGLGPASEVSLAEARRAAVAARQLVRDGRDPIEERRTSRNAKADIPTFEKLAEQVITARASGWRSEKHLSQWKRSLDVDAGALKSRHVDLIDQSDILAVLRPIWLSKPETANRLRARIEAVLDVAIAAGFRSGPNPAMLKGNLGPLLPKRPKVEKGHYAALPYTAVPDFIEKVRARQGGSAAAYAIEFLVLTAGRMGEIVGARWEEIDLENRLWTVPAERMKAHREHVVPLSDRAIEILEAMQKIRRNNFVFAGRGNRPMSCNALRQILARMKASGFTLHGFRSSFRDWAGDATEFSRDVVELALAHAVGDATERAYRRGSALEKRRALMAAWAAFVGKEEAPENVVPLQRAG